MAIEITPATRDAILRTWSVIGPDTMDLIEDGDPAACEIALEMCIDAGRLTMYGGPNGKEAEAEIRMLIHEQGYQRMLVHLAWQLRLGY